MHLGVSIWMVLVALLSGLAAATLLYVSNKKQHYGKPLTIILFALRTMIIALVVLLLFNPFIRQKFSSVEQPVVVVAHDNSASIVLCKDSAFYQSTYQNQLADFMTQANEEHQVDAYQFGEGVSDFEGLDFSDQLTDISSLLQTLNRRYYKRNVGAVVLFSDGISNRGFEPELIAEKFPYPIHTVVLGDTVSYPDLALRNVHYNKQVSLGATYPIRVTVSARDLAGRKAMLTLSQNGNVIEKQEIEIPSNRFSKEVDFMLEADAKGVKQIDIEVSGIAEEEQLLNNVKHIFVEVLDKKYKVLCYAASPHPDLAAIRSVLNDNYEVDFAYDKDGMPDFGSYDLVVLHQIPTISTNVAMLKSQLDSHPKQSLLFVVGPATDLHGMKKLQGIFDLQPGSTNTILDVKAHANASFSTFTIDSKVGDIVTQYPPLALPHIEFTPRLSHDDLLLQDVMGIKSGLPLLSFSQDVRKTAFLFGTNVWRWRLFEYYQTKKHDVFDEIFSKSIKYLLLSANDGSSIYCKEEYYSNEPVIITAELRNLANELVTEPELTAQITNKLTGDSYDFTFSKRDHDYELNAGMLPEGLYIYKVEAMLGDRLISASGSFAVVSLGIEAQQLTADVDGLRKLSHLTNGKCYGVGEMQTLLADLEQDARITSVEHHESRFEDLIHSKWIWFVLIGLAAIEWLLRKMFGSY